MIKPQQYDEALRNTARINEEDIAWWNDRVARGLNTPEQVRGYVEASERVVSNCRFILSFR